MNDIELLSPAGNLEKLKIAYLYGADAVYFGGKKFNLRSKADNFSIEDMKKASQISLKLNKKIYLALNIFLDNSHVDEIIIYLKKLNKIKIDGIIISDPGLIYLAKIYSPNLPIHLSTQANTQNWPSCVFWEKEGIKKIVLGREVILSAIKNITEKISIPIEVFVHGSMCMAYSGRCMLSMYMTSKSANKGLCTHPCRWKYYIFEEKRKNEKIPIEEHIEGTYIFNSKDLCMLPYLEKFIEAGVKSFKIEGRMKSIHYIATVTKAYREVIDLIKLKNKKKIKYKIINCMKELIGISERDYTTGFYFDKFNNNIQQYNENKIKPNIIFVGKMLGYYKKNLIKVEQRNKFSLGEELEVLMPKGNNLKFIVKKILNEEGKEIKSAPHPKEIIYINSIEGIAEGSLLRKRR